MTTAEFNQRLLDNRICQHSRCRLRVCECVNCVLWRIEIATKEQERAEQQPKLNWFERLIGIRG